MQQNRGEWMFAALALGPYVSNERLAALIDALDTDELRACHLDHDSALDFVLGLCALDEGH
jgi:hypothetical protein